MVLVGFEVADIVSYVTWVCSGFAVSGVGCWFGFGLAGWHFSLWLRVLCYLIVHVRVGILVVLGPAGVDGFGLP